MEALTRAPAWGNNSFQYWQADYAAHGIPTVPVEFIRDGSRIRKKPMVGNAGRFGLVGSSKIAAKFAAAPGIGFMCGKRSGITVLDWDSTDEHGFADALNRHGATPLIARTASGKLHGYYRHNGERRWIRPRRDLPMDILGAQLNVAPPSQIETGCYQFVQGSLDDLDSLPVLLNLAQALSADAVPTDWGSMREGDGRNDALFRLLGRAAHSCDDYDQLLDYATTKNKQLGEPMEDARVVSTTKSVWKMTCEGRNRFGQHGAWFPIGELDDLITDRDAFALLGFLRAHNHPDATFWVANGLTERLKMSLPRLQKARRKLTGTHLHLICGARDHEPALYRFTGQGLRGESVS